MAPCASDSPVSEAELRQQMIWRTVMQIPPGNISTYGRIAALAGLPRGARQVGRALKQLAADTQVPWHRVVNSQGRIAFPPGSVQYREQTARLRAEGVLAQQGRIKLRDYLWRN